MDKVTRVDFVGNYQRGIQGASSGVAGAFVHTNTRVGSPNPNWKKRIADQSFVASPYTRNSVTIEATDGACGASWDRLNAGKIERCFTSFTGGGFANSQGIPVIPFLQSDVAKASSTANSRLLDQIRQEHTESNGMLMLGELRETIKMMRNPIRGMTEILKTYATSTKRLARRSRSRRAFQRGIVPLYLELVFGWKPLISDIGDIARTAARYTLENRPVVRVRGSSRVAPYADVKPPSFVGPFDLQQRFSSVTTAEANVYAIAYLRQKVGGPTSALLRLSELSGFTLENFVPTIYNLLPWSFVIDYGTNLGDVIEGYCTSQSNVIGYVESSVQTVIRRESLTFDAARTISAVGGFNHRTYGTDCGRVTFKRVQFERKVGGSVPVPDLHLRVPTGLQNVNLVALALQLFDGISQPRR